MARLYMVTKATAPTRGLFAGVFTNRKLLMEALTELGLTDCYIQGSRARKLVTSSSIGTDMVESKLIICRDNEDTGEQEAAYRIREITPNIIDKLLKGNL